MADAPASGQDSDDDGVPGVLLGLSDRLRGLTGFVSALCAPGDQRPLALARYYHVRRVAWLAHYLCEQRMAAGRIMNRPLIATLAWGHDLNRWPFAHNSEKGLFDQSSDLPRYIAANNVGLDARAADELRWIADKSAAKLTEEGRTVLLADMIAGFVEDPLWAVVALDLAPDIVPPSVAEYLGFPLESNSFKRRLLELNLLLYETRSVEPFETRFDELFRELAVALVHRRKLIEPSPLGTLVFEKARAHIKEDFMRRVLFPYNNERVSMGSRLKREIMLPLLDKLGEEANATLTSIDDRQAIALAVNHGVVAPENCATYVPYIDYVTQREPQHSFRRRFAERSAGA